MERNKKKQFRKALLNFWIIKLNERISAGQLDSQIESFLNGDNLEIKFSVQLAPNDVVFMRELLAMKTGIKIIKKLRKFL